MITIADIRNVIAEHLVQEPHAVVPTSNLFDDFGADDLDEIEILMELEEKAEIVIPDRDYVTVQDFIDAIRDVGGLSE